MRRVKLNQERIKAITKNWEAFESALKEPDIETAVVAALVAAGISGILWRPFHSLFSDLAYDDEERAVRLKERFLTALNLLGYEQSEVYYWFSGEGEEVEEDKPLFDDELSKEVIEEVMKSDLDEEIKKTVLEGIEKLTFKKRNLMLFAEAIFIDVGVQLKLELLKEAIYFAKNVIVPEIEQWLKEEKLEDKNSTLKWFDEAFKIAVEKLNVLLRHKEKLEALWKKRNLPQKLLEELTTMAAGPLSFHTQKEFKDYIQSHPQNLILEEVAKEAEKIKRL